jgi:Ca2+-transporting ATPase
MISFASNKKYSLPDKSPVEPVHTAVQGRVRFSIKGLKHNQHFARYLKCKLTDVPEIFCSKVNYFTGTVLIYYGKKQSLQTLRQFLLENVNDFDSKKKSFDSELCEQPAPLSESDKKFSALFKSQGNKKKYNSLQWHTSSIEEVSRYLSSNAETGLTKENAQWRTLFMSSLYTPEKKQSDFSMFLSQFSTLPVALLGVSSVLSLFGGAFADAVIILTVIAINAFIGYSTEKKAQKEIDSLKKIGEQMALVIRDGKQIWINATEVVPGDVVYLTKGLQVPADCRLIKSQGLHIDESILTGESLPVHKHASLLSVSNLPPAEQNNIVFKGTLVTGGEGLAIAIATGEYTELGNIQQLALSVLPPPTHLERELNHTGNWLVKISGIACGSIFLFGLLRGVGLWPMLRSTISLAIAAVPEGLPAVATTTLAFGVKRMRVNKILVRELDAIEGLGNIETVCLDKTGTLTENRMSVTQLVTYKDYVNVNDDCTPQILNNEIVALLQIMILCSENGHTGTDVSSTETALSRCAHGAGIDANSLFRDYPLYNKRLRSGKRNYMSTVHTIENRESISFCKNLEGQFLIATKGNPQEVFDRCSHYVENGELRQLGDDQKEKISNQNREIASLGLRVLGCAFNVNNNSEVKHRNDLIWLGLVGMSDPIRPGTSDLINAFHSAGINTIMITGDQAQTATSIGMKLGLSRNGKLAVIDSGKLQEMEEDSLAQQVRNVHIFARVNPAQKLQIVKALQKSGHIVAMTGDGVNDSPALRAADIGIAMGKSGTDAARESASIIIEDDDLKTLITAISEGRNTVENIGKSVHFLVSTNMSEVMLMSVSVVCGVALLTPMQLLWINLISDIFPSLALSMEPPSADILHKPPRAPSERILSPQVLKRTASEAFVITAASLAGYGLGIFRYGAGPQSRTMGFLTLTTAQLLHTLSCRSDHLSFTSLRPNNYVNSAVIFSLVLQAATVLVPGLRGLLSLESIRFTDWLAAGAFAGASLLTNEFTKSTSQLSATHVNQEKTNDKQ